MLHHVTQHIHPVGVTKGDGCRSLLNQQWFSHTIFFLTYLTFPLKPLRPSQMIPYLILDQTACAAIGHEVRNFPVRSWFTPSPFRGRHAPSLFFNLLPYLRSLHHRLKSSLPSPSPSPSPFLPSPFSQHHSPFTYFHPHLDSNASTYLHLQPARLRPLLLQHRELGRFHPARPISQTQISRLL